LTERGALDRDLFALYNRIRSEVLGHIACNAVCNPISLNVCVPFAFSKVEFPKGRCTTGLLANGIHEPSVRIMLVSMR